MNVIQTYFLEDQYIDYPDNERIIRKDEARKQLDVLMHPNHTINSESSIPKYLEPNEDGFYPGLEQAGRLDV